MPISTNKNTTIVYIKCMKVKLFDESHEEDLEQEINDFLEQEKGDIIDIKFSTTSCTCEQEQIYCFSAMIIYE